MPYFEIAACCGLVVGSVWAASAVFARAFEPIENVNETGCKMLKTQLKVSARLNLAETYREIAERRQERIDYLENIIYRAGGKDNE